MIFTAYNTNEQGDFSNAASQDGERLRRQVETAAGWSMSSQQEAPAVDSIPRTSLVNICGLGHSTRKRCVLLMLELKL